MKIPLYLAYLFTVRAVSFNTQQSTLLRRDASTTYMPRLSAIMEEYPVLLGVTLLIVMIVGVMFVCRKGNVGLREKLCPRPGEVTVIIQSRHSDNQKTMSLY
jgi:uncharacterized membrane protein